MHSFRLCLPYCIDIFGGSVFSKGLNHKAHGFRRIKKRITLLTDITECRFTLLTDITKCRCIVFFFSSTLFFFLFWRSSFSSSVFFAWLENWLFLERRTTIWQFYRQIRILHRINPDIKKLKGEETAQLNQLKYFPSLVKEKNGMYILFISALRDCLSMHAPHRNFASTYKTLSVSSIVRGKVQSSLSLYTKSYSIPYLKRPCQYTTIQSVRNWLNVALFMHSNAQWRTCMHNPLLGHLDGKQLSRAL